MANRTTIVQEKERRIITFSKKTIKIMCNYFDALLFVVVWA